MPDPSPFPRPPALRRRGLVLASLLLPLAGHAEAGPAPRQELASRGVRVHAGARSERLDVQDAWGSTVGDWTLSADGASAEVSLHTGVDLVAPRFQRWLASPDGRTLLGAGDTAAVEHPFRLDVVVYRDGELVHRSPEPVDVESSFAVAPDGTVGMVVHAPGDRARWEARVLDPLGVEGWTTALPEGRQAADLVVRGDHLLVLTHEPFLSGTVRRGFLTRVDATGARDVADLPGAQELVEPAPGAGPYVRTDGALLRFDEGGERVLWSRPHTSRPAGTHAWAAWTAGGRDTLAVVTSDVRRRDAPRPPVRLEVFDAETGTVLGGVELERRGPLALVRLAGEPGGLTLEWAGTKEVFTWQR